MEDPSVASMYNFITIYFCPPHKPKLLVLETLYLLHYAHLTLTNMTWHLERPKLVVPLSFDP